VTTLVRAATRDDAAAIAQVRVETWRAAYADLIDQAVLDRLDPAREAERRRANWDAYHSDPRSVDLVAVRGENVIGWATAGPAEDPALADHGQLFALYVVPRAWSTGAGHALIDAAEGRLRGAGFTRALLWVLDGNDRAASFYESHGWHEDGGTLIDDRLVGGSAADALHERRRVKTL